MEYKHLVQDLYWSVDTLLLLDRTKMGVYPAGHHPDCMCWMLTQGRQVREHPDADIAVLVAKVESRNLRVWPKKEKAQRYHSGVLEEHSEVVVDAGSAVVDLADWHEDHICLLVDDSSTVKVGPIDCSEIPHSGRLKGLSRIRKRVKCGRTVAQELVPEAAVLHNCSLVVEPVVGSAAEAAVRRMFA